uniref:DUF433 domain-containing protein n=1 Tax=Candidatus Kentrum sp. TUN TaxID=2126343 RepID=A0A451AGI7_9GAMM|nr:MAG: Protein of unknown function (DUF433) [Candidatus Kentron sp. TUN]VFK65104.1 MAG: Protein of unknown function (DUF433) [Candidatus Kentron sp. TUN]
MPAREALFPKAGPWQGVKDRMTETMDNWIDCPAVECDPGKVSGAWVFRGTRVPVSALFENIEDGVQRSEFVSWLPGVTLQQACMVLEHVAHTLETA